MENFPGVKRHTASVIVIGGILLWIMVWLTATFFKVRLLDFEHYLQAASLIWHGKNPYGEAEFFAPPWFAIVLTPFLFLPEKYSVAVWVLLNFGAVFFATIFSIQWMLLSRPSIRISLASLTPVFLPGALFSYITGQVTPLVNVALLLTSWGVMNGKQNGLMVFGLLFATVKPHVVLFPLVLVGLELFRKRRWNVFLWTSGILLILILFAFMRQPDWISQMVNALTSGDYRGGQSGLVSTGYTGLTELGIPIWVFVPLLIYTFYKWMQNGFSTQLLGLAIVVNFLIIPYSRSYDYVLFIFPLMVLGKIVDKKDAFAFILGLLSAFVLPFSNFSMLSPVVLAIAFLLKPLYGVRHNLSSVKPSLG